MATMGAFPYSPNIDLVGTTPFVFRHLSENNDGVTLDMNVDGSVTPVIFEFAPPAGFVAVIVSVGFEVKDLKGFSLNEFGNLGSALTNGLTGDIREPDDTILGLFTQDENIKENSHFYMYFDNVELAEWGTGDDMLTGRSYFIPALGAPMVLKDGNRFAVTVQDDLTGLEKFHMYVGGYYAGGVISRDGRK